MSALASHTPKVNFVIAGTQKGGTSTVEAYLRRHPEICTAWRKEVHFFDTEEYFQSSTIDYRVYHSYFDLQEHQKRELPPREPPPREHPPREHPSLIGEATPIYMYWYGAPRRMWAYNPGMKLIVLLRNPVERAFSHWNMEYQRGNETLSFWDAIRNESERCREALPNQHRVYSYLDRGFYTEQLRRIWHYFPRKQTLVLKFDQLQFEPEKVMDTICDFLGVARLPYHEPEMMHTWPYVAALTQREWDFLIHVFEYEIKELERLLGWDNKKWLIPNENLSPPTAEESNPHKKHT